MNAMDRVATAEQIARLDGFLAGVAACNGRIRDYTSFSYIVDYVPGAPSIEASLKIHFSWNPSLEFSDLQQLNGGLRDLEIAIRPFLVREDFSRIGAEKVELRQFLSFRAMELLSSVIATDKVIEIVKVSNLPAPLRSDAAFFCIRLSNWLLVLQFNDDIEFKRRHGS